MDILDKNITVVGAERKISDANKSDLIRRTKERLEYATAIHRFSDVAYLRDVLEYLEGTK